MDERVPDNQLGFCDKCGFPMDNHAFLGESHRLCPKQEQRLRYGSEFRGSDPPDDPLKPPPPFDDPLGPMPV